MTPRRNGQRLLRKGLGCQLQEEVAYRVRAQAYQLKKSRDKVGPEEVHPCSDKKKPNLEGAQKNIFNYKKPVS
jgi:hypothetical protein